MSEQSLIVNYLEYFLCMLNAFLIFYLMMKKFFAFEKKSERMAADEHLEYIEQEKMQEREQIE